MTRQEVTARERRRTLLRTIPLGTIVPAAFIAIALVQQPELGTAMRTSWWVVLLAFVVGAVTVALPRRFPLIAAFVAILVFAGISTATAFNPIAAILFVLAGFFFGLFVRSVVFQVRAGRSAGRDPGADA